MASFAETAPPILTDIEAARSFIRSLDRAGDLMEAACAAALLVMLALDAHLERMGKDNHAEAMLETVQWLHARLAQLLEVWKTVEGYGRHRAGVRCLVAAHGMPPSSPEASRRIRVAPDAREAVSALREPRRGSERVATIPPEGSCARVVRARRDARP